MRQNESTLPPIEIMDQHFQMLYDHLVRLDPSAIVVLVDDNTAKLCLPILQKSLEDKGIKFSILEVNSGEDHKGLDSASYIWRTLSELKLDRKAVMICLGGGMITDLGAFCASVYKRGISFIHLPTTLLSMVDAAIGGKSGVDLLNYKNQIGVFNHAEAVLINTDFLKTLPAQELKSGMAEVYKHGLIADRNFWSTLSSTSHLETSVKLIEKAASIKAAIVQRDPFENGERKLLNFGHSIGHGLESFFLSKQEMIPHGYAIAAGMICEAYISHKRTGLSKEEFLTICDVFSKMYPKLSFAMEDYETIIDFIHQDKKNEGGKNLLVLLSQIGDAHFDQIVSDEEIEHSLSFYLNEF